MLLLWHFKHAYGTFLSDSGETFNVFLQRHGGYQFIIASYIQQHVYIFLLSYIILILILLSTDNNKLILSNYLKNGTISSSLLTYNILSIFLIANIYIFIRDPDYLIKHSLSFYSLIYTLTPVLWFIYIYTAIQIVLPYNYLYKLINKKNNLYYVFIALYILIYASLNGYLLFFWSSLLLSTTLDITIKLSHLFGLDAHLWGSIDNYPIFGTNNFQVEIQPGCSGYEGMTLAILLLSFYLFLQKSFFKFPRVLIVIPIAFLVMFVINSIRLVILVAIGDLISPAIALNGFHSVAGWINLIFTLIICIYCINKSKSLSINVASSLNLTYKLNQEILLLPLMLLIAVGLLTKIVTADFEWFYPLPIAISVLTFYHFRAKFYSYYEIPSVLAVGFGILVFFIWVYLVPVDESINLKFIQHINGVPIGIALIWLFIRILGSVIVAPLAEEFAFRGYIFPKIEIFAANFFSKSNLCLFLSKYNYYIPSIISLFISSIIFGILHTNLLAGSLAGFIYGLVYLHRRKISDAVVAHSVTNLLLSFDAIFFGNWSYW